MEFRRTSRRAALCSGARVAILIVIWPSAVPAQQPSTNNSVEDLRKALCSRSDSPHVPSDKVKAAVATLSGMRDLGRALILPEWRLDDWDHDIVLAHRENHAALTKRFEHVVRIQLASGEQRLRQESLDFLIELSSAAPAVFRFCRVGKSLTPQLAEMMRHGAAPECETAAHALAVMHPEINVAVAALGTALLEDVAPRRVAAARALGTLVRSNYVLATSARGDSREAHRKELVDTASAVALVAGRGMDDVEVYVRLRCIGAVGQAATALHWLIRAKFPASDDHRSENPEPATTFELADVTPLARALKHQSGAVRRALADPDAQIRLAGEKVLEDMAAARQSLMRSDRSRKHSENMELRPANHTTELANSAELLLEGIQKAVPAVTANVQHPDVRVRRHAVDVLETLGPDARPAAKALVGATSDPDRFVRWAAARTLGKIAPVEARTAIPALEKLRNDVDADVRRAAVAASQRYVTTPNK